MSISELRQRLGVLATDMHKIADETPESQWTTSHAKAFDAKKAEFDQVQAKIDRVQSVMDMTAEDRGRSDSRSSAPARDELEILNAVGSYMRTGDTSRISNSLYEGGNGAAAVPSEMAQVITSEMKPFSPMRNHANVVQIGTSPAQYVQPHSPTGTGFSWFGEVDPRPETDAPTIVAIEFADGEVAAITLCSQSWEDDAIGGARWLIREQAKSFARAEGAAFLTGNGVKKPMGILSAPTSADVDGVRPFGTIQAIASGHATAITADGLINLQFSLLPEYRQNAVWLMNSASLAAVRKLKDSTGAFLWVPSLAPGQPQMLLGHEVVECNDMPNVAADALAIIFGDMKSGYTIVDRSIGLLRDPYSSKPYVAYYGRKRVSGNFTDTCALKIMKIGV